MPVPTHPTQEVEFIIGYNISPYLVDAILLSFVHRWNLNAAVRNKGHEELYTSCTELVDVVQSLSWRLFGTVPFADHVATPDVPDEELEPFGCQANPGTYQDVRESLADLGGGRGDDAVDKDDDETAAAGLLRMHHAEDGSGNDDDEPAFDLVQVKQVSVEQLLRKHGRIRARTSTAVPSAAVYHARVNNIPLPIAPVESEAEVHLFWLIVKDFLQPDTTTVDWSAMADAYNKAVAARVLLDAGLQTVLRVKQSEHLIQYAEAVHARYRMHVLNKDRLPGLREMYAALNKPITCDINWAVSVIGAFHNHNTCPAGCVAVHDAGLMVLPPAAGLPVPGLQPARHTMSRSALQRLWFDTAVATLTTAAGTVPGAAAVRDEVNRLARAAQLLDIPTCSTWTKTATGP
jgi:hypothetical protein